ncbi:MAG: hypothetical protein WCP03_02665, partial [Candidatus Saccharibacteria bacterium]
NDVENKFFNYCNYLINQMHDRYHTLLVKVIVLQKYLVYLLVGIVAIGIGLSIVPSDIKIVSHYSAFGVSNYYTDNWLYLINFVVFGIVVSLLHIIISVKLLAAKGRAVSIMFIWSGIGVIMIGWVIFQHVLNVLK